MKLERKYKTIITVCLLALNAFIATPVSFWHHHTNECDKYEAEQHSQIVKKSALAIDTNCEICSHHYSVANKDATNFHFSSVCFFSSYYTLHVLNKIANPGYSHSNKGPPAIA